MTNATETKALANLDETVDYVLRYGGRCRDCADSFGVCPNSGMPCKTDQRTAVIRHTIEAIEYGVKHGFLANPFVYPAALEAALAKVNDIRNSIIGTQTLNWSEHVYPLVAALEEVGVKGMSYTKAREYFGTMLERTVAAEDRAAALEAKYEPKLKFAPCAICGGEHDNDLMSDICRACEQRIDEEGSP